MKWTIITNPKHGKQTHNKFYRKQSQGIPNMNHWMEHPFKPFRCKQRCFNTKYLKPHNFIIVIVRNECYYNCVLCTLVHPTNRPLHSSYSKHPFTCCMMFDNKHLYVFTNIKYKFQSFKFNFIIFGMRNP